MEYEKKEKTKNRIQKMAEEVLERDIYPEIVPVNYDPRDEKLSEEVRIAKRLSEYLLAQKVELGDDRFLVGAVRFDGSVPADIFTRCGHLGFGEVCSEYYNKPLENLSTFEWQHSSADFGRVIARGLSGYLGDINASRVLHTGDYGALRFLVALETMVHGILNWADKCSSECFHLAAETTDPVRKAELLRMSGNCARVPRFPARTFEEAVQCLCFCFMFLPDSIGRPDQYLYPLYRKDLSSGVLTRQCAKERLQELFIIVNGFTKFNHRWADRGGESHFVVGGYTKAHEDGFNELSELIIESMMELNLCRPQVSLRWTEKTPRKVFRFMMDCERRDRRRRIAFVNDEPRLKTLMEIAGLDFETASDYIMVGCNEPAFQGSISLGGNTVNILRSLLNALDSNRVLYCGTFDEFYDVYEKELFRDLEKILDDTNHFNLRRAADINILSSLFLDGCIESARSATRGGVKTPSTCADLMGFVNVIDSLSVIQQFVFEERQVSMSGLIDALKNNWKGAETLHAKIVRSGRFFGNADELSDSMARRFTNSLYKFAYGKKDLFGTPLRYGNLTGYITHYANYGKLTGASPDGRYAGEPLKFGSGQSNGYDRNGSTALLSSAAGMDPSGIMGGNTVMNLMVDASVTSSEEGFGKLVTLVETFFKMGGLHIQLSHVSPEEMIAARKSPEEYQSLRVRVSGFSATFVKLDNTIQTELIHRTGHSEV